MEHLKFEEIHAYMEGQLTTERKGPVEGHLAACERCSRMLSALKGVSGSFKSIFKNGPVSADCTEDWVLAALIKDELMPGKAEQARTHINNCEPCMERAAVYYKAHSQNATYEAPLRWKEKAVSALSGREARLEEKPSFSARVYEFVKRAATPAALPGYAIAAAASIILMIWAAMPEKPRVVTIASSERIAFKDSGAPASFGFMGAGKVERFEGMKIEAKKGEVLLKWKGIEGADEYVVSVIDLSTSEDIITKIKTPRPEAAINIDEIKKNELHRWTISGATRGGESFEYTGEFLISE